MYWWYYKWNHHIRCFTLFIYFVWQPLLSLLLYNTWIELTWLDLTSVLHVVCVLVCKKNCGCNDRKQHNFFLDYMNITACVGLPVICRLFLPSAFHLLLLLFFTLIATDMDDDMIMMMYHSIFFAYLQTFFDKNVPKAMYHDYLRNFCRVILKNSMAGIKKKIF